jgi:malonate-semialdehyde dehydrogenase (acetylating)/methylmalonate-semialdehyde dehydrogenase
MTAAAEARSVRNFIGGQWVAASSSATLPVNNPATGELLGRVPLSAPADAAAAVEAARKAFPAWRATPAVERARIMFRLKMLLERELDSLAVSLACEHGKVLEECKGEIRRGIENVEHACGVPTLMMGVTLEDVAPGIDCETILQPLGVFAGITPYNFPVMIPLWFWPYAVATGNTFVLKPSEQDPLTHERVVELALEAGVPAGVLNVVHGTQDVTTTLLDHPDVKGISFVGSSQVARSIYQRAAVNGKRVQALGGAKNYLIVLPDADLDLTTDAILASVYGSTGQRCLAGSVIVGVQDAYPAFRERFLDGAASIQLGYALDGDPDMGPVISRALRDRITNFIAEGVAEGAKLVFDGREHTVRDYPSGHWIGPTVFENVNPRMVIGKEEIFGPVAGLASADSIEAAIDMIHDISYGNMTSIFTTSGRAARQFRYHAGISMLGINIGVAAPMAFFPFGGSRDSFYGDLKAQGRDAIDFYTDKRVIISRW